MMAPLRSSRTGYLTTPGHNPVILCVREGFPFQLSHSATPVFFQECGQRRVAPKGLIVSENSTLIPLVFRGIEVFILLIIKPLSATTKLPVLC